MNSHQATCHGASAASSCIQHQVGGSRLVGGSASERAQASFSVVVIDLGRKGVAAVMVAGEGLAVGPFVGQGVVETFDLDVLPGAVGLDEFLSGPEELDLVLEGVAVLVSGSVVRHHPFIPTGGEVVRGSGQKPGAGVRGLVIVDLAVGQS